MLYLETVESGTFSILKELMQMPALNNFGLVGGTALSLLFGHRKSVDIDLFSTHPFENDIIVGAINSIYSDDFVLEGRPARLGIFGFIRDIKIDLIYHPFPLIRPMDLVSGIRMFSREDIIAMKIQAILGRGMKKDFWDIAELLNHFSLQDFIRFHKEKYNTQYLGITIPQALTYFAEADDGEDPVCLKEQTWEYVKQHISKKVSEFLS